MTMEPEAAVRARDSGAAKGRADELCCPVSYNPEHLEAIPVDKGC